MIGKKHQPAGNVIVGVQNSMQMHRLTKKEYLTMAKNVFYRVEADMPWVGFNRKSDAMKAYLILKKASRTSRCKFLCSNWHCRAFTMMLFV